LTASPREPTLASMTPQGIASRIDAVTVYRRGARITRVADLAADGVGYPRSVRLTGLPLGLDDASVRARVEPAEPTELALGAGTALPTAVDLRVVLDVPDPDPSLRPADDAEVERARLDERMLERDVADIEHQLAQLERLGLIARPRNKAGAAPSPSPTSARLSLIRFKTERERQLAEALRQAREQLTRARRRRDMLEDLFRRASTARQAHEHELRKAVVISLGGDGAADAGPRRCRLVLDYLVPGARWAPVYALRLDDGMTGAALSLRAMVAQDTGEDWAQVALTLSTAEAQAWTELPELASIRIGRRQPSPPRVGWRPPPTGVDELYRDWDREFGGRVPRPTPSAQGVGLADETTRISHILPGDPNAITGVVSRSVHARLEGRMGGDDFDEDTAVHAAPPAAMPMAQPMPAGRPAPGAPPPPAARGRRTTGSMAAAPGMIRTLSARQVDKKTAPAAVGGGGAPIISGYAASAGFAPGEPPPPAQPRPVELEASADLLRYGDLRMPPASSRRRGRLVLASRVELYLALLIEQRVEVRFDVLGAVEGARQRSLAVTLPPGCVLSWAEGYDYAYRAESRVDVPSDGDAHSLPLVDRRAKSEPLYVVVPRESTDVFRTATVANPLESPLLPGPVDVYLRGDFLLTSRIELTAARGKLTVGLGVEQGIKVARNTRYREESAGLMGGALVLHHHIDVELRSNLKVPAPIEVRERIPVIREDEDDIQVTVPSVKPAWEAWEQDLARPSEPRLRGGYRWRLTLGAGAREELRADYDIRIPAKQELSGGNRREG